MNRLSTFESRGNIELLSQRRLLLFASSNAPEAVRELARDIFRLLMMQPIALAGGWQSPLEKELLARSTPSMKANIIYYLGRDIAGFTLPDSLRKLDQAGKLLLISPGTCQKRYSQKTVNKRDSLMLSHVNQVLFLYIQPQGRLEKMLMELSKSTHSIYVLNHPQNYQWQSANNTFLSKENINNLL